jgi:hypothetical protein
MGAHQQVKSNIRTPSIELPLLSGTNASAWILECEGIFELVGITCDNKIKWANTHIRGKPKTWLSSLAVDLSQML